MSGAPDGSAGVHVVVAAVLRRRGRALLVHRSPQRRWYPDVWDLPGGHVEAGEDPAQALARELTEELGTTAHVSGARRRRGRLGRWLGGGPVAG